MSNRDGTGVVRVVRTPGVAAAVTDRAPGFRVEEVEVAGPPTSTDLRAVGWGEAAVLLAAAGLGGENGAVRISAPNGAEAAADITGDGVVRVRVRCGDPLDEVVLRSYCTGAAHMALGWVSSEGIAVDGSGVPLDLTIRSFGVLRASETPPIEVEIEPDDGPPVAAGDAVFVAVAAAAWIAQGCPPEWPTGHRWR